MFKYLFAAAIVATTAQAEFTSVPMVAHCTNEFSEIVDNYGGELTPEFATFENEGGFQIGVFQGKTHQVAVVKTPDGNFCVIWDAYIGGLA